MQFTERTYASYGVYFHSRFLRNELNHLKPQFLSQTKHNKNRLTSAVYSQNHKKPINTLCGQNSELLTVKVGGTQGSHRVLKD
jgi:hypothetical protein